jgi:hypothetical protein
MLNIKVRLPSGKVRRAEVSNTTVAGYRRARFGIDTPQGTAKIRGRVEARHGFINDRALAFEIDVRDLALYRYYSCQTSEIVDNKKNQKKKIKKV